MSGTSRWRGRATSQTRDVDAAVADADPDGEPPSASRQRRAAAADPQHARDLERGEPDGLADDAGPDGQRGHQVAPARRGRHGRCGRGRARRRGGVAGERLGDPLRDPLAGRRRADPDRVLDHPPLAPGRG